MVEDSTPTLYCANHPNRETLLRCNRCDKPICGECAILTPTGYRCRECVRGQQKVFDTATTADFPLAFITAGVLSFLGSFIAPIMGFFTLFIAPIAGMLIVEAVRRVIRRHRSTPLFLTAAAGAALGALLLPAYRILYPLMFGVMPNLLSLIWYGLYLVLVTSSVYYRLSGIRL